MAWFDGFDEDGKAFVTSKGWNALEGDAAATAIATSYRELQKMHGGLAAGSAVILPKPDADAETQGAFWEKVGAPKEKAAYKFDGIALSTGESLEDGFVDAVREAALKARIPAQLLPEFVRQFVPYIEQEEKNGVLDAQNAVTASKAALEAEWGPNLAKNKFMAAQAMDTFGIKGETVTALENSMGYQWVMNHFKQLGEAMGEARFVPGGGHSGVMTPEEARTELARLQNDDGFRQRWAAGGVAEIAMKTRLIKAMQGRTE